MRHRLATALAAIVIAAEPSQAQIRASEIGTVSQMIDGTKLTVTYSRPRARGRDPLFGTKAVHWGEVWTPGANFATTLELSKPAKLNGQAVPKGRYSVWFVVREKGDWSMLLHAKERLYHMEPPDTTTGVVRFPVKVDSVGFTDVLTWSFPEIRADGGTLAFQWERKRVQVRVEVEPSLVSTLPAADAQPYLGRYEYTQTRGTQSRTHALIVVYDSTDRTLKARWDPNDAYMKTFAMIRVAPDWFVPGVYDEHGRIYEVYRPEMVFQFKREGARATLVDLRNQDDSLEMRATRKP